MTDELASLYRRLYTRGRAQAGSRGLTWELTESEHRKLVDQDCTYCGAPPSNELNYRGRSLAYQSLDRIDNGVGYRPSNLLPACRWCNTLRGSIPINQWADFIASVVVNHGGREPAWAHGLGDQNRHRRRPRSR